MTWYISLLYNFSLIFCFDDGTDSAVTVTSNRYVHVANEFLYPELRRCDIEFATAQLQQNGGTAPIARQSKNTLRTVSEHRIFTDMATFLGQAVRPICRLVISFYGAV
jgi:hypothetical protein